MGVLFRIKRSWIKGMDSTYTKSVLPLYYGSLNNASQSNNYQNADDLVESLNGFQKRRSKVRPSEDKITAEILLYNKYILQTSICLLTSSNFNVTLLLLKF
jgi:hypothetical protein